MRILLLVLFCAFWSPSSYASTCYALSDGIWENGAMWSSGNGPACGDSIVIPAGITVTVTTILDYSATCLNPMKLSVLGSLVFQTGKKLRLPCSSGVYVYSGGMIDPGNGGGSSNLIEICNVVVWNAGMGPFFGPDCLPAGSNCNNFVLPVELLFFNATKLNTGVLLEWKTAVEVDNDRFVIEKSIDGNDFTDLFTVKGAGNSSIPQFYSATDPAMLKKTTYYRLKQVDFNGKISFSKIIAVKSGRTSDIKLHPNPAGNEVYIFIENGITNEPISIYDYAGRMIKSVSLVESAYISTADLNAGVYYVIINNGSELLTEKLVISR